jgi:hypothetical protein
MEGNIHQENGGFEGWRLERTTATENLMKIQQLETIPPPFPSKQLILPFDNGLWNAINSDTKFCIIIVLHSLIFQILQK